MISTGRDILYVGAQAAASLRQYRAGLLNIVVKRNTATGQDQFDVVAAGTPSCPQPCVIRIVRGKCPRCTRPINMRLGSPRRSLTLAPLPVTDRSLAGFGGFGAPPDTFAANWPFA